MSLTLGDHITVYAFQWERLEDHALFLVVDGQVVGACCPGTDRLTITDYGNPRTRHAENMWLANVVKERSADLTIERGRPYWNWRKLTEEELRVMRSDDQALPHQDAQ